VGQASQTLGTLTEAPQACPTAAQQAMPAVSSCTSTNNRIPD
jgi:hypothetical protein